ncbi:MAG: response regulator [Arcobacter sp.]|nr:response regulator [Arcobacter sp.]
MRDRYSKEISMLYIEKNNVIRKPISMLLKKVVKKLYLASNENDGFYLFLKYRPSLVLIDISTNEINYIAILKQIREIDSEVSIIIISAHNENKLILKCLEFNIHNYIKRPINKNFLLKSIENNAKMIYVNKINKYQQNEIINQKILLQNIIDSQKEMIIVTDFKEISFMNDSFLNFFKISNSEEFKKK